MKQFIIASFAAGLVLGQAQMPDARLENSAASLREIMRSPDKSIPRDLIDKSQCVVIVPDLLKGAFLVGGKYGRGFASCRHGNGWSSPAAVRIEGGSFGFQLGGSATDLIMLVMNRHGMQRLLGDKFTIGGEAAAAAGPVGRNTTAQTDIAMHAEILSWSRSRGLFAGISLEGATLRPDSSENRKLYGRKITNREILETGVPAPRGTSPLMAELHRFSGSAPVVAATNVPRERKAEPLSTPGGRLALSDRQIHFASGQAAIPPGAEPALADIAKTLQSNPSWRVRVEGFTDSVGGREQNRRLSQERAEAIATWLSDHGVDRSRLSAAGYGELRPIADNATPQGRAQNRRVELVRIEGSTGG
ncbi:MAG TPA: YSC84-related protein [Bryobacteraceae bacterium]|nr:YSC84-related protein [Bryobacteraceae bacterium]